MAPLLCVIGHGHYRNGPGRLQMRRTANNDSNSSSNSNRLGGWSPVTRYPKVGSCLVWAPFACLFDSAIGVFLLLAEIREEG